MWRTTVQRNKNGARCNIDETHRQHRADQAEPGNQHETCRQGAGKGAGRVEPVNECVHTCGVVHVARERLAQERNRGAHQYRRRQHQQSRQQDIENETRTAFGVRDIDR